MSLLISIFSRMALSISITILIFLKSVDISIIDTAYRYIEQPYFLVKSPLGSWLGNLKPGQEGEQVWDDKFQGKIKDDLLPCALHFIYICEYPLRAVQWKMNISSVEINISLIMMRKVHIYVRVWEVLIKSIKYGFFIAWFLAQLIVACKCEDAIDWNQIN